MIPVGSIIPFLIVLPGMGDWPLTVPLPSAFTCMPWLSSRKTASFMPISTTLGTQCGDCSLPLAITPSTERLVDTQLTSLSG